MRPSVFQEIVMILAWPVRGACLDFYFGGADGISFADLITRDNQVSFQHLLNERNSNVK